LQPLQIRYRNGKEALEREFRENLDESRYLRRHASLVDGLIASLAADRRWKAPFCVFAIGGYGRCELFPHSDIDLLILQEKEIEEEAVRSILHALWDLRLDLGHQVWSLDHLREVTAESLQLVLSMLDLRLVYGDPDLAAKAAEDFFSEFLRRESGILEQRVVELTVHRHEEHGATIYHLEPNLKEAPGGLRDYLAGRWLRRLWGDSKPLSEETVESARFLSRIRVLLHLRSGRGDDRLSHRFQEAVAQAFGYRDLDPQHGVEALMQSYYLNARQIHRFCRDLLRRSRFFESPPAAAPESLPEIRRASDLLKLFVECRKSGLELAPESRSLLRETLPQASGSLDLERLTPLLRQLLAPGPGLYRILSEMYEVGFLELLLPEFGNIKGRVIRDFYHRYTVDEHTLVAVRNIERLDSPTGDGRFLALLREAEDAWLLTLALLLHDVGKGGRGGGHTASSARMAARALKRLRFAKDEIDRVVFLVRNHLEMSAVVFRRDLEDESVVSRFADLVADPERLRLLTLMTYADIQAVAPGVLTPWKKDLLWQLYLSAYRMLTLGYGQERIEPKDISRRLLEKFDAGADFERFLEGFPRRYLTSTPPEEIQQHFELSQGLSPQSPLRTRLIRKENHFELWVLTPDQKRLFATIAGLLSYFEMNILRGFGFANRRRTVLDIFQFADVRETFAKRPEEKGRLLDLLEKAVGGEIQVERLLEGKERSVLFQSTRPAFAPTVHFEQEGAEQDYSIVEIVAPDSIGLLYRISGEMARLECDIELALISTEGGRAVDVFYLSRRGSRLGPKTKESLRESLIDAAG
ncbi:MAG TPA: HD domain-containing protein, partial [Acidobacteriota bacterium]|nr:HD domain-containing protein [Acidobacteriota bacterium]